MKYLLSIIKYLLPRPLEVQYIEDADLSNFTSHFRFKNKMYYFWKNFNKLWGIYCGMQSAKTISGNFFSPFSSVNDF